MVREKKIFLRFNTFSVYGHIGPALLTKGLNSWHMGHEFHNLSECFMDFINMHLVYETNMAAEYYD